MKTLNHYLTLSLILSPLVSEAALKTVSRSEIIDYAKSAAGSRYIFGGSKWDPQNRKFGGPDCAGLVLKAWRWPLEINYRDTLQGSYVVDGERLPGKLYTGTMLDVNKYHLPWSKTKDYSLAQAGDAFTFNNGSHGHTFIMISEDKGVYKSIEARSSKLGVGYFERSESYIRNANYSLLKRNNVKGSKAVKTASTEAAAPAKQTVRKVAAEPVYYVVKQGDELQDVARKYKTLVSHIVKLNPSKIKNNAVKAGVKLQVK
jgi:LysM repeat protein